MPESLNTLVLLYSDEKKLKKSRQMQGDFFRQASSVDFDNVRSCFGIALHMHQPTIPAGTNDLASAPLISNLEYMLRNPSIGDNHNASVFLSCYGRMSDFIKELVADGKNPRVMLDYSGNLLWGLQQIEQGEVIARLKDITCQSQYHPYVEWLGTMWSHAVVSSTPVPDIKLHVQAWQHHFASIFGYEALSRVKGFSPPEMHLPIHPDVCYEYVKVLKESGYNWLMVQEHTIEKVGGSRLGNPYLPHKLVAKNSSGQIQSITVLIKTQGSDTKLVAQMQPFYEAQSKQREGYLNKYIPPFVLQISDGENGGVMMNEFPPMYRQVFSQIGNSEVVALGGTEYLEFLKYLGLNEEEYSAVQPISQQRIWDRVDKLEPRAADKAIEKLRAEDKNFNLDKASWTNDRNWVSGYQDVMDPINKLSAEFHQRFDNSKIQPSSPLYQEALLYLLLSQTSCFRYWGCGVWTDYAKEICRRGMEAISKA
ncbi:MAG: glycosyl hydrolase family 57 [Candidatus Omnitrophica bacterium]|nr:glycosyl hydrolase family 57 [Candidatus Omnitrophota bacterium]